MINEVISNKGKSRFLKCPNDYSRTYGSADFSKFIADLINGSIQVDITYSSTDRAGFSQIGTPLNEETLLNSAAQTAIWNTYDSNRTPSSAFESLGNRMKSAETAINSARSSITTLKGSMVAAQNSITSLNSTKLNKSGDSMTGNLTIANNSARLVTSNSSGRNVFCGIAADGKKTGLYDQETSDWILCKGHDGVSIDRSYDSAQLSNTYFKGLAMAAARDSAGDLFTDKYLQKAGDTMTGGLTFTQSASMEGINGAIVGGIPRLAITNVKTPIYDYDAANKTYVDNGAPIVATINATTSTCTLTYAELYQAISAGKAVILKLQYQDEYSILSYKIGPQGIQFQGICKVGTTMKAVSGSYDSSNLLTFSYYTWSATKASS